MRPLCAFGDVKRNLCTSHIGGVTTRDEVITAAAALCTYARGEAKVKCLSNPWIKK